MKEGFGQGKKNGGIVKGGTGIFKALNVIVTFFCEGIEVEGDIFRVGKVEIDGIVL